MEKVLCVVLGVSTVMFWRYQRAMKAALDQEIQFAVSGPWAISQSGVTRPLKPINRLSEPWQSSHCMSIVCLT